MGSVIADDLAERHDVTVVDSREQSLKRIRKAHTFLGDPFDLEGLPSAELVVTALPSEVAYRVVRGMLERGLDVVDISFTDYNPFDLDEVAKAGRALYIPHAGYAPGLSNILAGRLYYMEGSRDIEILVGGLQETPVPPMGYAPTFNASSVIDEYTRPARYLRKGKPETADPLEDLGSYEVPGVGMLETFYSDGLATLMDTMKDATVLEKTLRYPGHLEKMRFLRDMGYFSSEKAGDCTPREVSDEIFRRMAGDYRDLSILEVRPLDGKGRGYSCIDRYDTARNMTSMGRMTGFSAAAIAEGVLRGMVDEKGVFATEWIGRLDGFYNFVLEFLEEHGISITRTG